MKELVIIEKIPGVIETPSGIPPQIEVAVMMQKVMNQSYEIFSAIQNRTTVLIQAVKDAIEAKSWDSGHITGDRLNQMLESFEKKILKKVDKHMRDLNNNQQQYSTMQQQCLSNPRGITHSFLYPDENG